MCWETVGMQAWLSLLARAYKAEPMRVSGPRCLIGVMAVPLLWNRAMASSTS